MTIFFRSLSDHFRPGSLYQNMDLTLPLPNQAQHTLRALVTVARADGDLHSQEVRMIELFAEAMDLQVDVRRLESIAPETLAPELRDTDAARALIQRLVILTTLDGEVTPDEVAAVETFAAALGVEDRAVHNIRQISQGWVRMAAFDLGRRSFMPTLLGKVWREKGVRGLWSLVSSMAGGTNAAQAERFAALAELPPGTLGRELFDHFTTNDFPYPGQAKGAPDSFLFHDLGHVLGEYGTTPDQELLVAGFQAGYMDGDGLVMYLMIAMLFQLAVEPLANARGVEAQKGMLDIEAFLAAVERGRGLAVDLTQWDPWPHMERPLVEIRAELQLV